MMTGPTRISPITFRGLQAARASDFVFDLQIVSESLDTLDIFEPVDLTERMCSCPVCRGKALMALSEIATTPETADEDGYVVPDVQVGATGIVMPGRAQLARWFKVPVLPKFNRSKYHQKAKLEAKHHGMFTFFSGFSFLTVFFPPCPQTLVVAAAASGITSWRSYTVMKKAARKEDSEIKLEMDVRMQAFKARSTAWQKLYYCTGCGMVHDREGKRSLPWYSMLQLVHYPEQEFESRASAPPLAETEDLEAAAWVA